MSAAQGYPTPQGSVKLVRIGKEVEVLGRNSAVKLMLRKSDAMAKIEDAIATCAPSDRKRLRILNKLWWAECFGVRRQIRNRRVA